MRRLSRVCEAGVTEDLAPRLTELPQSSGDRGMSHTGAECFRLEAFEVIDELHLDLHYLLMVYMALTDARTVEDASDDVGLFRLIGLWMFIEWTRASLPTWCVLDA